MTNETRAIQLARELGYSPKELSLPDCWKSQIFLDPEFWKALSKALNWEEDDNNSRELYHKTGANPDTMPIGLYRWHKTAMRYFYLVLKGGNLEKFWDKLNLPDTGR